jgi:uncharacterized protein (DUF1501 family)
VRRHLLDLIILFVFSSLVAGYVVTAQPAARNVTLHVYVFLVGGLVMLGVVAAAGDAVPRRLRSDFDAALNEKAPRAGALPELEKLEREVTLGTASAYDLHYRLLPHLRAIAQARLERSGREPGPDTLGRWWELLRPDRQPPENRLAKGINPADLRDLVADLARM